MEKKITKKLLAVIMIITILATDFFVLGSGLITYATQVTNEIVGYSNIHFSTYFKEGENEVKQINKSVKDKELKLYVKIGVNSDVDYLEDIQIKLKDNNFNIISSNKGTVEDNTVKLDYIASGSLAELELNIVPVFNNKISANMLLKAEIELNAKYKCADVPQGKDIQATSEVTVKYVPDETTKAELETDIITNKIFAVNGTNKRIIQALIKSRLTNNEYPVKQTLLNISIPNLGDTEPEISALAIGQLATNGQKEIKDITTTNGKVQITLNNEIDENNQVSWAKNVFDEIIVTYIYPETVDASKVEITADSEISLHATENTYTATYTKGIENQEPNHVIIGKTEITTEELYKGNLYAKIEKEYNTKTLIEITNAEVSNEIVVNEEPNTFGTDEREISANTKYISTEINLENILNILGQDGSIEIKNGETSTIINKDTETNESGNVVINYENGTDKLTITTSKPVKSGVLELKHKKGIYGDNYTREQLQAIKTINARSTISATLDGTKIVENTTEQSTSELKETISKAELTIENNKNTLSTTEQNEMTIGITLVTKGEQYDLYKNPKIGIKFPNAVTNVELMSEANKQNADEFTVEYAMVNPENNSFYINLSGEQTKYPKSDLTQSYIQLNFKITLDKNAISQTDEIMMTYTNENATQYASKTATGILKQEVQISAPNELIKMFNINSSTNTSTTENILEQVRTKDAGQSFEFDIRLTNNKDKDMSNIKILGKLPTKGNVISNETNTLETKLQNIVAKNAKVYYTENSNATVDIEDDKNGWTETLTENAKLYLIKLERLERGESFDGTVAIQMSNPLTENAVSYTEYEVVYDTELDTNMKEKSRTIGLSSSLATGIKVETTAQVGQDILKSGDVVKEGEVIKYTVTVKNAGTKALENVQLKLDVPEGTTYVRPIQEYILREGTENEEKIEKGGYVYAENAYYEEITETDKLNELTNIVIPQLSTTEPYKIEYEVRVNKGAKDSNILSKIEVIYDGDTVKSTEISNPVKEANVRVTVKRLVDESIQLLPGGNTSYMVYVENLTSTTLKNLELQIIKDGINILNEDYELNGPEKIIINELPAKESKNNNEEESGIKSFVINAKINSNTNMININAIVKDAKNEKYRSNLVSEKIPYVEIKIDMKSPQDKKVVRQGDIVEYNIDIINLGDIRNSIIVNDIIPQFLQIQSISQNNEIKIQKTDDDDISNDVYYKLNMEPKETAKLNIKAKVQYIPEIYNGKIITNIATATVNAEFNENSQIITHILKANKEQENFENIISGYAWFDENGNGRRDASEEMMPGISVKLYNTESNTFVLDESGNILEEKTDNKGEYSFSNISNGKYLVIFEYDTEKYEFTTKYAEGVDTSLNSKVDLNKVKISNGEKYVAAIEIEDLKTNMFNMNIGLKERKEDNPSENIPGEIVKPSEPTNPTDPNAPTNPEDPTDPSKPEDINNKKTVSGYAWLDSNRDGKRDKDETNLSGIKVIIYNVNKNDYLRDENNNILETITDNDGKYILTNIEKGEYKLLFKYDVEKYEPTLYMVEGADSAVISKVIANTVNINGQEEKVAVTDIINVQGDISNINIGLREKLTFDLELEKYISRVVVQNSKGTKTYNYDGTTLAKVEIHRKQLNNTLAVIEYTIKVKNNGDISGYATNIVDYLPNGLTFNSELNKDWYILENNLHTKSLEKTELKPGEEKEIKLILTKTMTAENVGLINNRAEIFEDYNKYGEADIDSKPNNQNLNEDDMSVADIIIGIATGVNTSAYIVLFITNIILILVAIYLLIKNNIINIPNKVGRR